MQKWEVWLAHGLQILNVGVQSLEINQEKEKNLDRDIFSIRPRYFKCGPVRTSEELGFTQTYEGSEQSVGHWLIKSVLSVLSEEDPPDIPLWRCPEREAEQEQGLVSW